MAILNMVCILYGILPYTILTPPHTYLLPTLSCCIIKLSRPYYSLKYSW